MLIEFQHRLSGMIVSIFAFAVLAAIIRCLVYYLGDPYGLRRFPATSIAGFSNFWAAYHSWFLRRSIAVDEAHAKLGPIIKIQPTHVSFNHPDAVSAIYGHGSPMLKDVFYETFSSNEHKSIVGTRSREDHSRKRKYIAAAFSQKSIVDMEPNIREKIETLLSKFDGFTSDPATPVAASSLFNLRWWLNLFTFDVITKLAYDDCTNLLDSGTDLVEAETDSGRRYYTNAIRAFHTNSRYDVILAHWPKFLPWTKWLTKWHAGNVGGAEFTDLCIRKIRKRFGHEPEFRDFWGNLLVDNKGEDLHLPFRELVAEAGVMINAGSDTTATAMTSVMYHIIKNRRVFQALRAELDETLGNERCIATYDQVKGLKYLRACIDEGMRDRPPTGLGLPRVTPPEGAWIAGEFIPGGITVSVPTYTLHHNASLFPDPYEYRPERWLEDSPESANLRKYVMPFSQGPRACIGRNLAYLEQQILIATLVHNYDWQLEREDFVLPLVERFNQNPGDLYVKLSKREWKQS